MILGLETVYRQMVLAMAIAMILGFRTLRRKSFGHRCLRISNRCRAEKMVKEGEDMVDGAKYMVPSSGLVRYARMETCL